jgi:hypothetical protein
MSTSDVHLSPILRTIGTYFLFLLYAYMALTGTDFTFCLFKFPVVFALCCIMKYVYRFDLFIRRSNAFILHATLLHYFYYFVTRSFSRMLVFFTVTPWNMSFINVNNCSTRCDFVQLLFLANCSTFFGWYLHPSSGAQVNCNNSIWTGSIRFGHCQML